MITLMLIEFDKAQAYIINKLEKELPHFLFYHSIQHTMDVYSAACVLAKEEKIVDSDLILLKTAALLHDIGFVNRSHGHEEASCDISKKILPLFGYNSKQINIICNMIMATKIPQSPKNKLEQILCDADLDYLGRDDFYAIGYKLFKELKHTNILQDERVWNEKQIQFLETHCYFTSTSKKLREPKKQQYLQEIKDLVATY